MVAWGKVRVLVFLYLVSAFAVSAEYLIPDVKLEALKKGGFRASIPAVGDTNFFRFTANVNEELSATKPGRLAQETVTPSGGFFVLDFSETLKATDVLHFEILVYYGRLGYRKDGLSWTVKGEDLKDAYTTLAASCRTATTTIEGGKTTCIGNLIISEEFNGPSVDTSKWLVEQWIPTNSEQENYIFNSFINSDETRFFKNGILHLKPVAFQTDSEVRGTLDLTNGCTSSNSRQCSYRHFSSFLLPPVKSGRIKSKVPFKYGKIEIKAKLPKGDWIFPVLQLQPNEIVNGVPPKIWIAYSRGNEHLSGGGGGDDIGSHLLFAGPVLHQLEPERSKKLISKRDNKPFSDDFHVFTLDWSPGKLSFFIDGTSYGEAPVDVANFNRENLLTFGVGVGGLADFPDGYTSGSNLKPWNNTERNYVKSFFEARGVWANTWNGDNVALQIDYVKVWAI